MEIVEKYEDITTLKNNKGVGNPELGQSKIVFNGSDNILYTEKPCFMNKCKINFLGSNAVVYIGKNTGENRFICHSNITINNDCVVYFGRNVSFTGDSSFECEEYSNLIIGNDCMIAEGVIVRTTDYHMIFDSNNYNRINKNRKSVLIGDHVWLTQKVSILKNTRVGSGAILGFGAIASGKIITSNSIYAGNPAKEIKRNVFWARNGTPGLTAKDPKNVETYPNNNFVYNYQENITINIDDLMQQLDAHNLSSSIAQNKVEILVKLSENTQKNRFFIGT